MGKEQPRFMLARAKEKIGLIPGNVREGAKLIQTEVRQPARHDELGLVILGGNCFYELATADEAERCVAVASAVLDMVVFSMWTTI